MTNTLTLVQRIVEKLGILTVLGLVLLVGISKAEAATLSLSPNTGVYGANTTFTARLQINSAGQSINASEGTITFNPRELAVVSVSRASSIFNLWVAEPAFSNSAGTISFSGGLPSGYTGNAGTVLSVTFRTLGSGSTRVNFSSGSILANDGRGTNVLTSMNGGSYTIQALSAAPEPEVIEYVAPANTPAAPQVDSATHPDSTGWYNKTTAQLSWTVPNGVTQVRTLLDSRPTSIPTRVYETPISQITLEDLEQGESYFHIQFRNSDGWGRVTHYRLAVDSESPTELTISQPEETDYSNPEQEIQIAIIDQTSGFGRVLVKIGTEEPIEYTLSGATGTVALPILAPGYHSLIIEAFDLAGNSLIGSYAFTIEAFEKPIFTDFPSEMNEEVVPVLKGTTRPNSDVVVSVTKLGSETITYEVSSDASGEFIFIPEGTFSTGVYEITAVATDEFGAVSAASDSIRIAVQEPGFVRVGSFIISLFSIIIPLIALSVVTILGLWYLFAYLRRFRKKVGVESAEALDILQREFSELQHKLREQESFMQESRKTKKLTKAESDMIQVMDVALQTSQRKVEKEIQDVRELTNNNK